MSKIIDVLLPSDRVGQRDVAYPDAVLLEGENEQRWRITPDAIERHDGAFRLRAAPPDASQQAKAQEEEISLAHDVLDKQVIDVEQKKAVRVNDVCFADDWCILGIDNSTFALIRRLAPIWLWGGREHTVPSNLIPWSRIELIGEHQQGVSIGDTQPVPRIPSGQLAEMHPADIAEIVHQLTPAQGARIIEGLDDETAADTMEEIDTERQRQILENIPPGRVVDILQAMGPDEAADLLAQIPEDRAQELLRRMTPEESEDVQDLLEYEADTAGGLMTTDFVALNQDRTVEEALQAVRSNIIENDVRVAYIYCVADETQDVSTLLGTVSLWELLIALPEQQLRDLMETDLITVQPDSEARTVAEIMAKYNLLAVPVVSEDNGLEGIVTVDDALDVLLPPERRRKPTRMY